MADAGDVVTEHLGLAISAHAEGRNMTGHQVDVVRGAILLWHRLKTALLAEERSP